MVHGEPDPPVAPFDSNSDTTDLSNYADKSYAEDWCDIDEVKDTGDCEDASPSSGKRVRDDEQDESKKAAKAEDGSRVTTLDNLHSATHWFENLENQLAGNIQVEMKRDDEWSSGVVIVDGLNMKTKAFLRELRSRMPQITKYMKPSDVKRLNKGGFLLRIKPEDCRSMLGWIGTLSKDPGSVRVHPPAGATNSLDRTVFVYGIHPTISDVDVKDCLLPPAESVQRCYRDGRPTTT